MEVKLTAEQRRDEEQAKAMVGQRYGHITITAYLGKIPNHNGTLQRMLRARCECGYEFEITLQSVVQRLSRALARGETQENMRWMCEGCFKRLIGQEKIADIHAPGYFHKRGVETLCWTCDCASNGKRCSWARAGRKKRPRTDWDATRRDISYPTRLGIVTLESYFVSACPGYVPDRRQG